MPDVTVQEEAIHAGAGVGGFRNGMQGTNWLWSCGAPLPGSCILTWHKDRFRDPGLSPRTSQEEEGTPCTGPEPCGVPA